jgi:hypothetical protein
VRLNGVQDAREVAIWSEGTKDLKVGSELNHGPIGDVVRALERLFADGRVEQPGNVPLKEWDIGIPAVRVFRK